MGGRGDILSVLSIKGYDFSILNIQGYEYGYGYID